MTTLTETGTLVTVTYTDPDATQWTFHGRLSNRYHALTVGSPSDQWGFVHHRDKGTTAVREWVQVAHVIADQQYTHKTPLKGRDWEYSLFGLNVCVAEDSSVQVVPLTDEGREWLHSHESAEEKRDRLLARFATFDAASAEALELVITELVGNAVEDERVAARCDER
jgi:hypothetical protein